MGAVLRFEKDSPSLGLKTRPNTIGPEWDLVQGFENYLVEIFNISEVNMAVFYEPKLDTGFPDIVIAEFDPAKYFWNDAHFEITPTDLKVLNLLHQSPEYRNPARIIENLNYKKQKLEEILFRLLAADLIEQVKGYLVPRRLEESFGISRLIAVEAKIGNAGKAVQQALVNKWFASESYILLPQKSLSEDILDKVTRMGIGVIFFDTADCCARIGRSSTINELPACHSTWMFNEWLGRSLYLRRNSDIRATAFGTTDYKPIPY